jgi:transcription elongation GreA/GreB family factor
MSRAFTKERDDAPEPALVLRPRHVYGEFHVPPDDRTVVGYSATVVVEGAGPAPRTFTIVDEDQTDLATGRIGIDSPLAQALLGARAGATVTWHRPVGDANLRVISVSYR